MITVSDIARAAEFNEGKLGLSAAEIQREESRSYACGGDTSLHVYTSAAHAGRATAALATWYAADLEEVVDEQGIHELGEGRVAWSTAPDGNTSALEQ